MKPPFVDLNISLFIEDKDLLEKITAYRDEPLPIIMRQWIRTSAHRYGFLSDSQRSSKSKPTEKTKIRAEVFRRIKSKHRTWSQSKVAMEAVAELGESVSGESVRNAYRAMKWTWQRGDRVR